MLKNARCGKHGGHPTILSRCYGSESYRNSLYDIGWREKHMTLYVRIALEKHIYNATRAERIQNSNNWILTINAEGPHQALNQRPDFAQVKRECKRLHDEHLARTQEEYGARLTLKEVGGSTSAVKPAGNFVRIAGQPADSFVIVVKVGPNPLEDWHLEFSAIFKP